MKAVFKIGSLDDIPANESGTWDLVVSNPPHFRSVAAWNAMLRRRAPGAAEGASDPRHFRGVGTCVAGSCGSEPLFWGVGTCVAGSCGSEPLIKSHTIAALSLGSPQTPGE